MFEKFEKIKNIKKLHMSITQKIHGTNAQVNIYLNDFGETVVEAGSRNRQIFPHDDNYGFAAFVEENKEALIERLGHGRHYGEWCGPGINSGEGLDKRMFLLFNWSRYHGDDRPFPDGVGLVPLLYSGAPDMLKINEVMADLKSYGSKLVPGFMRPEGIVVTLGGVRWKKVFDQEESAWKEGSKKKVRTPKVFVDYSHLCQPIRLEKLLSKDERYIKNYPTSLKDIVKDYVQDLIEEEQITGNEDEVKSTRKGASSQIFKFVKEVVDNMDSVNV